MLTLVVLEEVGGLDGLGRVALHDVVVEQGRAAEETEAAGAAEHAAEHVLRRLLEPVADGVLEDLVPHQGACVRERERH